MKEAAQKLEAVAKEIRRDIFKMAYRAGGAHLGACFSCVEILVALYQGGILRIQRDTADALDRDRFILSKGHASAALYAVLARAGFFPRELLWSYCQSGTDLGGHPDMHLLPGVEATTGALGHGLPFALGHALAAKLDGAGYHTYVLVGDGECQEGSVWEALLFAPAQGLTGLTMLVDANGLQAMDKTAEIIPMGSLRAKLAAFNWQVEEVDGHSLPALLDVLSRPLASHRPRAIIAHTVKGKGIPEIENVPIWHYRMPDSQELPRFLAALGLSMEELTADA